MPPEPMADVVDRSARSGPSGPLLIGASGGSPPRAAVLLLPGGKAASADPTTARQLTVARMQPFAAVLRRAFGDWLAVHLLRYRVRGWNGSHAAPVHDARWALAQLQARYATAPVVLVGHSMGGRAAIRLAAAPGIAGVVALAPWLPDGEPVAQLCGARLVVAHGSLDCVTSPRSSRRFVQLASAAGADARYVSVLGDTHAMLLHPRRWHRLVRRGVLELLHPVLESGC